MIKMSPQYWTGCNCAHMSISNILEYLGFNNPRSVWKQCGIKYIKDEDPMKMGVLYSNHMSFQDELYWIHNVKVHMFNTIGKNDFINNIKNFIRNLKPVVVFVDSYYLKQAPAYQSLHANHTITITGYDNKNFHFVDDAFNTKGTISEDVLISCASNQKSTDLIQFDYFVISIDENKSIEEKDYESVIERNYKNLINLNNDYNNGSYIGYEGLKVFSEDFYRISSSREVLKDEIMDLYHQMVRCANQHFLFGQFLSRAEDINEELKKIEVLLGDLAQEMKVCANMFLKATLGNKEKIFNRISPKLENTCEIGGHLIGLMEGFLNKSCVER